MWLTRRNNWNNRTNAKSARKQLSKLQKKWQFLGKIYTLRNFTHINVNSISTGYPGQVWLFDWWSRQEADWSVYKKEAKIWGDLQRTWGRRLSLYICESSFKILVKVYNKYVEKTQEISSLEYFTFVRLDCEKLRKVAITVPSVIRFPRVLVTWVESCPTPCSRM